MYRDVSKKHFHNNQQNINNFFTRFFFLIFDKMAYGYKRSFRRGWYKRGTSYAAKRGTAQFTCRIPIEDVVNFKIPATTSSTDPHQWSNLICTCPYAMFTTNDTKMDFSRGSLLSSYLYRTYTRIYDQVKVNAVAVSIGVMEGIGIGGLNAVRLYTNWDRDLTFEEFANSGVVPTTPEELATGSESQSYLLVNNSKQTFKRYIAARDVQERTTFHDCSYKIHNKTLVPGSSYVMYEGYYGDEVYAPLVSGTTGTGTGATAYGTSGNCGFVPSLAMAIWSPSTFNAERSIPVSLKVTYSVTFRMPKFGLASSSPSSKLLAMRTDAVSDVIEEEKETKEMDEEPPIPIPSITPILTATALTLT